jgi:hypothetical protein
MKNQIAKIIELLDTEPINTEPLENGGCRFWNIEVEFEVVPHGQLFTFSFGNTVQHGLDEWTLADILESFLRIPELAMDYLLLIERINTLSIGTESIS